MKTLESQIFSQQEILEHGITSWKYVFRDEKSIVYSPESVSIWDYLENHLKFRNCLDSLSKDQFDVFYPYLPLTVSRVTK